MMLFFPHPVPPGTASRVLVALGGGLFQTWWASRLFLAPGRILVHDRPLGEALRDSWGLPARARAAPSSWRWPWGAG